MVKFLLTLLIKKLKRVELYNYYIYTYFQIILFFSSSFLLKNRRIFLFNFLLILKVFYLIERFIIFNSL